MEQKHRFRCEGRSLPSWIATDTRATPFGQDAGTGVARGPQIEPHLHARDPDPHHPSAPNPATVRPGGAQTNGPAHKAPPQFHACGFTFARLPVSPPSPHQPHHLRPLRSTCWPRSRVSLRASRRKGLEPSAKCPLPASQYPLSVLP